MKYQRFGDTLAVRIDRGEEILEQMKIACTAESVRLAGVSAIGAVDRFTVGVYDVTNKTYRKNTYEGAYEIVSLLGNVSEMNGEYYAHLHMCAADASGACVGGHLNGAVVSATCEMLLSVLPGSADRFYDDITGLNLLKL